MKCGPVNASKFDHTRPQHSPPPFLQSLPAFSLPLTAAPPLYSSRLFSVHGALRFEMMLNFRRLTTSLGHFGDDPDGRFQGSILVAPGVGRAAAASGIRELELHAFEIGAIQRPLARVRLRFESLAAGTHGEKSESSGRRNETSFRSQNAEPKCLYSFRSNDPLRSAIEAPWHPAQSRKQ